MELIRKMCSLFAFIAILLLVGCVQAANVSQCGVTVTLDARTPSRSLVAITLANQTVPSCYAERTTKWARFLFTPLVSGNYTFYTEDSGTDYKDTVMEIYNASSLTCDAISTRPIACDDDMDAFLVGVTGGYSRSYFYLAASQTVVVFVGMYDTTIAPPLSTVTLTVMRDSDTFRPTKLPTRAPVPRITSSPKGKTLRPTTVKPTTRSPTMRLQENLSGDCKETLLPIPTTAVQGSFLISLPSTMTNTTTRYFVFSCLKAMNSVVKLGKVFMFQAPFAGRFSAQVTAPYSLEARNASCLGESLATNSSGCSSEQVLTAHVKGQLFALVVFNTGLSSNPFTLAVQDYVEPLPTQAPTLTKDIGVGCGGDIPSVDLSNQSLPIVLKDSTESLQFSSIGFPSCVGMRVRPVMVYKYRAAETALYVFDTLSTRGNADTVLQVVTVDHCETLGCNDDTIMFKSKVQVSLQAKETVLVFVSAYQAVQVSYILSISQLSPTFSPSQAPTIVWVPDEPECTTFVDVVNYTLPLNGTTQLQRRRKLSCNTGVAATATYRFVRPRSDGLGKRWFKFHVTSAQNTALEIRSGSCRAAPLDCDEGVGGDASIVAGMDKNETFFILVAGFDAVPANFTLDITAVPAPSTLSPVPAPTMPACLTRVVSNQIQFPVKLVSTMSPALPSRSLSCGRYRPTKVFEFQAPTNGKFLFSTVPDGSSARRLLRPIDPSSDSLPSPVDTVIEIRRGGCVQDFCADIALSACPYSIPEVLGCSDDESSSSVWSSLVVDLHMGETVFVLVQEWSRTPTGTEFFLSIEPAPTWRARLQFPPETIQENLTLVRNSNMNGNVGDIVPTFSSNGIRFGGVSAQVFQFTAGKASRYLVELSNKLNGRGDIDELSIIAVNASNDVVLWSGSSLFSASFLPLSQGQQVYLVVFAHIVQSVWYSLKIIRATQDPLSVTSLCDLYNIDIQVATTTSLNILPNQTRIASCGDIMQETQAGMNLYAVGSARFRAPSSNVYWISLIGDSELMFEVFRISECPLVGSDGEETSICGGADLRTSRPMELVANETITIVVLSALVNPQQWAMIRVDSQLTWLKSATSAPTMAPTAVDGIGCNPPQIWVPTFDNRSPELLLPLETILESSVLTNDNPLTCAVTTHGLARRQALFLFYAPETAVYSFQTFNLTTGSDTVLEVRRGRNCTADVVGVATLACADDRTLTDWSSRVLLTLTAKDLVTIAVQWTSSSDVAGYLEVDFYPTRRTSSPTSKAPSQSPTTSAPSLAPTASPSTPLPSAAPTPRPTVNCAALSYLKCLRFLQFCKQNKPQHRCVPR